MKRSFWLGCAAALALATGAAAAPQVLAPAAPTGPAVKPYVSVAGPGVVRRHVRIIDGTGAPAQDDRTVVIQGGRIAAVGGPELAAPAGARILDLPGRTVLPGLVGLHD